jgi:hypothetical protein
VFTVPDQGYVKNKKQEPNSMGKNSNIRTNHFLFHFSLKTLYIVCLDTVVDLNLVKKSVVLLFGLVGYFGLCVCH